MIITSIEDLLENLRWNLTLVNFTINLERWGSRHPQLHALPDVDFKLMQDLRWLAALASSG